MAQNEPVVTARTDHTHDGLWWDCPSCSWEHGLSWGGPKECSQCEKPYKIEIPDHLKELGGVD